MAINVVVNTGSASTVQVKPTKTVAAVAVVPTLSLGALTNVDATDPDDGESLVYDAANNVFVVKQIEIDSNNITNINGGIF